ncbi:MAG TPA: ABC transporter permease [Spirochaetales bacterium]|nr:ABC transporter permease [Spirochaetales bacterium]
MTALFLLMVVLNPGEFLRIGNLQTMAFQLPELGLLSLAMMVTMLTGGINLSIIATANMSGIVTALILTGAINPEAPPPGAGGIILLAVAAGLLTALVIGLLNGLLVARLKVSPILATLGTMTLVNGLAIVTTRGYVISGLPNAVRFIGNGVVLGIPVGAIIFILCAALMALILNRTPLGFNIYMLGSNPVASRYSGVNNTTVIIKTYLISSLYAGFAALIMLSRFNSAKAGYGKSYLLITILASVLGGTSAAGGFGRVSGLVMALVILQVVSSGLNLLRVSSFLTITFWGVIIILVMVMNFFSAKLKERRLV